jgi:hypothetical protein
MPWRMLLNTLMWLLCCRGWTPYPSQHTPPSQGTAHHPDTMLAANPLCCWTQPPILHTGDATYAHRGAGYMHACVLAADQRHQG